MRSAEWFIARRYLLSRERTLLASMITIIAMLGVAVGVAALIVVISVMDGADEQIVGRVVNLYPHVRVKIADAAALGHLDEAMKIMRAEPGVEAVMPKLEKRTLIQSGSGRDVVSQGIQLIAIDTVERVNPYNITLPEGLEIFTLPDNQILLGWPLANRLNAFPQNPMLVYANNPIMTAQGWRVKQMQMRMFHWFTTRLWDYDAATAFVNTKTLRELFRMPTGFDYIHVKLKDPFAADRVMASLEKKLPAGFAMTTWSGENKQFFSALKLEKIGLFVILLLAVIVAGFNIICTMFLVVNDKTREIGILKAVGATRAQIARVFMFSGILIGGVGTFGGLLLGLFCCWLVVSTRIGSMPQSAYQFSHLPVNIEPRTVLTVLAASALITIASATIPARRAARLHPVDALRHD